MSSFNVIHVSLRCNGCGKVIQVMGDTAAHARELAAVAGWRAGRQRQGRSRPIFDACPGCDVPEGYDSL